MSLTRRDSGEKKPMTILFSTWKSGRSILKHLQPGCPIRWATAVELIVVTASPAEGLNGIKITDRIEATGQAHSPP